MVKQENIHLALAFDQHFITPFYVLLTSIFHNNKQNHFVLHTIATGLEEKEKSKITAYVHQNNSEIYFYHIDEKAVEGFVLPKNSHFSLATYYRLFFPALVPPEVDKLLYIDTDIIVLGNLSELYNTSIDPYPVAAVPDPGGIGYRPDLGIVQQDQYFNAGVLLINLPKWRELDVSKKTIQFLNDYPEKIKWVDQDALNAVLVNNWFKLKNKFNLTYYDIPPYLPKKEFDSFIKDKIIIHYTTQHKPWLLLCANRFKYLYHYYLKKSPHATYNMYSDEKLKHKLLLKLFKIRVKEFFIDHTHFFGIWKRIKSIS